MVQMKNALWDPRRARVTGAGCVLITLSAPDSGTETLFSLLGALGDTAVDHIDWPLAPSF